MQDTAIDGLIPHRGRMKLIASIVQVNNEIAITSAVVADTWPLYQGGAVNPIVLIEVAAQTAGVLSSWKKGESRAALTAGMLTGIKKAEFFVDHVPLNAILLTTATTMYSLEDYEAIAAEVRLGEQCLCKVQLQIFALRSKVTQAS